MAELRQALVTGANKGIGLEVARQLAAQGFRVWVGSRNGKRGEAAVKELASQGLSVTDIPIDVTNDDSVASAARAFGAACAKLHVLVNNAAILLDDSETLETTSIKKMRETFETNVLGPVRVTQAFLPYLKKAAPSRIINVSSGAGQLSGMSTYAPAYSISKTALNAITRQFSAALRDQKISVNSVSPGWVRTDMGGEGAPRSVEQGASGIVWLATEAPTSLTGKFVEDGKEVDW